MSGKVTLVGAGTGRAGLMTLDGLRALRNADVVVYDRLLGEGVYELIPENAVKINAGKESSDHTLPQEEINKLLISEARKGNNVVRLKGGDPYLFGRGAEEAEALAEADIPFSVIPGVTSAAAAPAYAGIPVTHRDYSSSVHIITGHRKNNNEPDIDFASYAKTDGTLVFLMGLKNLGYIAQGLMNAGMSPQTPCALIENGASSVQKKAVSSLSEIEKRSEGFRSPCIIIVGKVCTLSDKLDWFSALPLKGVNIIITRPYERAAELAQNLRDKGAHAEIAPCIETHTLHTDVCEAVEKNDTILFTSPAGVDSAFELIYASGKDARIMCGKTIGVTGEKTAAELKKYGIKADIVPSLHTGGALAREVCKRNCRNILIVGAKTLSRKTTDFFEENNVKYEKIAVYDTEIIPVKGISADYVIFASPSEVKGFSGNDKNFKAVCIGTTTLEEAEKQGLDCIVSENTDTESLVSAIIKDLGKNNI